MAGTGQLPVQGVVITSTIPPTVSHFSTRPAYVYLPPAWFAKVTPSLPTLVLLPGEPGSASDWSGDGDADNTADAFAQSHHGLAPIIVMPDPNGYEDRGLRVRQQQVRRRRDLPGRGRAGLRAAASSTPPPAPGSLAVGGLSAGGTCSVMLALRHPSVYPTFASFSGFASPQYQETTLAETIDTLFGGSEDRVRRPRPDADSSQRAASTAWPDGSRWGTRTPQPLQAAHNLQPAALRAGIATCIAGATGRPRLRPLEPGPRGLVPMAGVAAGSDSGARHTSRPRAPRREQRVTVTTPPSAAVPCGVVVRGLQWTVWRVRRSRHQRYRRAGEVAR